MENRTPLDNSLVQQPRHSRLSMLVTPQGVHVTVVSQVTDGSLIYRYLPFDRGADSVVRAFEDAVYDNPLLLADFGQTDVLIDTHRYLVMPAAEATADRASAVLSELYPDSAFDVLLSATGQPDGTGANAHPVIAAAVDSQLMAFIRRTFSTAAVQHSLAPLCRYFGLKRGLGNSGKLHVHLDGDRTHIIAYGSQGLLMANTVHTPTPADVAYYVLAAARHLRFDNANDRLVVSGDTGGRDKLLPILRKHISFVMPLIFPSEVFRTGRAAMEAPFQLVIQPLLD